MVTRSQSSIVKPVNHLSLHTSTIYHIPKSPFLSLKDPHWCNAMYDEYNALVKNSTWILVPRLSSVNLQLGVDFDDTFSPAVKSTMIRMVLSLAVSHKWPIHQVDVKNAFLNGDLSETVYMHQPPGFVDSRYPHHVCLLQRSLYGLKQAPRAWFQRFVGYATRVGFYHSRCDSSLFIYRQGSQVAYLLIYVDDIILTTSSPTLLQQIIDSLHSKFDMTDLEVLNYFLGISVVRHPTGLFLSRRNYALQLFGCAHIVNCNPFQTVVDMESKLGLEGVPIQDLTLYRSLARGLQYLTFTRLDLSYAVQQICYCVFLGDNLLSWSAKRRHTLSRSSAKAEYLGVANVMAETAWLRNLLRELHSSLSIATLVYCDNVSANYMYVNPVQHQLMKHIEIDIHFVRDMVTDGEVRVLHVPSSYQYADIFTK
ncbi:ribonuclease H-like domain-containing protein [Tanacetum coccineum]